MTSVSKTPNEKEKVFFPNLDALRFFSFLGVFFYHNYKVVFNYIETTNPWTFSVLKFFFSNGNLGVNFFFVLSGFLITYLLIKEKEATGGVDLKRFYIRRVLRIWPLFYLCIIIGFLIFPLLKNIVGSIPNESANLEYYLFFINNLDFINNWPLVPDAMILVVLWSVAVEEQFYIVWPIIVKYIRLDYLKYAFLVVILVSLIFRYSHSSNSTEDYAIRYFHTLSVIGDMALGGMMALVVSTSKRFFQFISQMHKTIIILIYSAAVLVSLFKNEIFVSPIGITVERLVIGTLFGFIILEQSFNQRAIYPFKNLKVISKLGIYTYGLYCFHFLVISIFTAIMLKLNLNINSLYINLVIVIVALLASVAISLISYHSFEKRFLKLKEHFALYTK